MGQLLGLLAHAAPGTRTATQHGLWRHIAGESPQLCTADLRRRTLQIQVMPLLLSGPSHVDSVLVWDLRVGVPLSLRLEVGVDSLFELFAAIVSLGLGIVLS